MCHRVDEDQEVVPRPYFEHTAKEEPSRLNLPGILVFLQEQTANQETRQHEKKIDACPPKSSARFSNQSSGVPVWGNRKCPAITIRMAIPRTKSSCKRRGFPGTVILGRFILVAP